MYDLVAGSHMLHISRYFSKKESMEAFPTLAVENAHHKTLKGTVVYYDGQMNDSRLNVSLACTAALAGAAMLNHADAVSLKKDPGTGKVIGICFQQETTPKHHQFSYFRYENFHIYVCPSDISKLFGVELGQWQLWKCVCKHLTYVIYYRCSHS